MNDFMNKIYLNEFFSVEMEGEYAVLNFKKSTSKLIIYDPGLYHTAVCKSSLSKIDKQTGKLYYRNNDVIEKLGFDYLDVAFEIIFGIDNPNVASFKPTQWMCLVSPPSLSVGLRRNIFKIL
jgi:formylmethanofuran dehydrogenase subunit E-like metal-binding protein